MIATVAATGGPRSAEAGRSVLATGNAVDAVVAACLTWPAALASSGALVAVGAGIGRVSCRLPARIPGNGLSRPRRARLLSARAAAAAMATPCAASALSAALSRWGSAGLPAVVAAARAVKGLPHDEALELFADSGAAGFVKGPWGLAVARALGPVEGGLLTRRDLIEAKPELGDAVEDADGWISSAPEAQLGRVHKGDPAGERRFLATAVDLQGAVAALALDAGRLADGPPPTSVLGVETNTLLIEASGAMARKVGRGLELDSGAAGVAEGRPMALCGSASSVAWALRGPGAALRADPLAAEGGGELPPALLLFLGGPEPRVLGEDAHIAS